MTTTTTKMVLRSLSTDALKLYLETSRPVMHDPEVELLRVRVKWELERRGVWG